MAIFFTNWNDQPTGPFVDSAWTIRLALGAAQTNLISETFNGPDRVMRIQGGSNGSRVNSYNPLDNATDIESLVKFRVNGTESGRQGIVVHRYSGTTEATTAGYGLQFLPASSVKSLLISNDATGATHNYVNYAWVMGSVYWARFRTVGTAIQAKVWKDGDAEPGSWMLNSTDSSFAGGSGTYNGVGTYTANIQGVDYLSYSAGTGGDTAPTYTEYWNYLVGLVPTSTPQVGYGAGYGGAVGYGRGYGEVTLQSALNIVLAPANTSHSLATTSPLITQVHNILVDSTSHTNTATNITLTQLHNLTVANTSHTLLTTSPTLIQNLTLAVDNTLHSLVSDNISLNQQHNLIVNNTTHGLVSSTFSVSQAQILAINNAVHALKSDNVNVIYSTLLNTPDSTVHGVKSDELWVIQNHILEVDDAIQRLFSKEVRIINWDDLGVGFGGYIPVLDKNGELVGVEIDDVKLYIGTLGSSGKLDRAPENQNGMFIPNTIQNGKF